MHKNNIEYPLNIDFDRIDDDLNATKGTLLAIFGGAVLWTTIFGLFFYFHITF